MPRAFDQRLGSSEQDFIPSFERAAKRNFKDAERLRLRDRRLGAIYLYGYSVEMLVKAAYFRMVFAAAQPPLPPGTTQITGIRRRDATSEYGPPPQGNGQMPNKVGHHDVSGWATLLTLKRGSLAATNQAVAYNPSLATEVINRADRVYNHWKEYMRYRAFTVYTDELDHVREDANWFRRNYQHL